MPATLPMPLEQAVWAALEDVHDPEIPALSVVDLGVVDRVEVAPGRIRVDLLPTFVGCPAVDLMRKAVETRLAGMAPDVEAVITFARPWSSDRITPRGRERLRSVGFAPPPALTDDDAALPVLPVVACPSCGSLGTSLENAFGPTLCRSIHHCATCRQPFEALKAV